MSLNEQEKIIGKIVELVKANYVCSEKGREISERIMANFGNGRYQKLAYPADFARRIDSDLAEISGDKHLGLLYDPDRVKEIRKQGKGDYTTKEMVEEERRRNFGFKELKILTGNVGYVDLRIFMDPRYAGETAVAAMNFLSNCDAIIVDLRNNGGGWGTMVAFLISYFLDGADPVHLTTNYSRPKNENEQSWTMPYVPGKRIPDSPLYVLTSRSTFSAAEEFCYCLKHLKRATLIGETTRGGAHPIEEKVLDDNFVLIIPEQRSINPITGTNWEGVGVEPHVAVQAQEALNSAHTLALEALLSRSQNEDERSRRKWHLDVLRVRSNPPVMAPSILESYVGDYESNEISLENDSLYYRRGGRARHRMIPMTEESFLIEDEDDLRLRFVRKNDSVETLEIHHIDGATVTYSKNVVDSVCS